MSTISTTTHRKASLNLFIALAIVSVVVLAFALAPAFTSSKSTIIPLTGNQNAYVDFLRGEKEIFTRSVGLSTAFSMYLAGEKAVYANPVRTNDAVWEHNMGEKAAAPSLESAMLDYRMGEKNIN